MPSHAMMQSPTCAGSKVTRRVQKAGRGTTLELPSLISRAAPAAGPSFGGAPASISNSASRSL
jgi:hypothetical protein